MERHRRSAFPCLSPNRTGGSSSVGPHRAASAALPEEVEAAAARHGGRGIRTISDYKFLRQRARGCMDAHAWRADGPPRVAYLFANVRPYSAFSDRYRDG